MTKEEKKKLFYALLIAGAVIILLWLLNGGSASAGGYTGDQITSGDLPDAGNNYSNYNVLPGTFPPIGGINMGGPTTNTMTGGCCAPQCGNPANPSNTPYWFIKALNPVI